MDPRHVRAVPDGADAETAALDALLVAAGSGSAEAFESLYDALSAQVYRLTVRVLRDPDLAQDAAQEAMLEVWRKAPQFDPERGHARAWVLTLAHRRAVDRVRREQRQRDQVEAEAAVVPRESVDADQDTVIEVDFRRWQSHRVTEALDGLTDIQRRAIELAFYSGLTHAQVSEALAVPLGTAKTRIRDGLNRLRATLEGGVT